MKIKATLKKLKRGDVVSIDWIDAGDIDDSSSIDNKSLNRAIRIYFPRAGLKGYGSKYLRRHLGELALGMGQSETWVQQALGHALDSDVTKKYMRVREGTMLDVFEKIAKRG